MKLRVMPYVTVEIDDRLRRRARSAGERLGLNVRAYLLSAVDDVDTASDRIRGLCDRAVDRLDTVVANVTDKIAPTAEETPPLHVVRDREPTNGARPPLVRTCAAAADHERAGEQQHSDDRHRNRPHATVRHR